MHRFRERSHGRLQRCRHELDDVGRESSVGKVLHDSRLATPRMRSGNGVRAVLERKRRRSIDVPGEGSGLMGKLIIGIVVVGLAMTIAFAVYDALSM